MMRARLQKSIAIVACWFCLNIFPESRPLNGDSVEYPVKLAFLYNFAQFVEWPADSYSNQSAPLSICIVGHDPFSPSTEGEIQARKAWGHPVEVLKPGRPVTLTTCHIVFIPVSDSDQAGRILRSLKGSSALTVGETEGFAAMGGIINLTVEKSQVHFEVNRLAADRAHLKISSRLLNLARIVPDQDSGPKY
jgi:YfiR/HmsC-like